MLGGVVIWLTRQRDKPAGYYTPAPTVYYGPQPVGFTGSKPAKETTGFGVQEFISIATDIYTGLSKSKKPKFGQKAGYTSYGKKPEGNVSHPQSQSCIEGFEWDTKNARCVAKAWI